MDRADVESGRKIACPVLVIWGAQSHTEKMFDARIAWPQYAKDIVKFCPLPCGHYPAEQVPEETYAELDKFFKS
jgi:haloacetate dehalogenase